MKKILLLLLISASTACSADGDTETQILYDYAPIIAVEMPQNIVLGEELLVKVTYTNPSPCHKMFGFEHVREGQTQYLGIVSSYYLNDPLCAEEEGITEVFEWGFTAVKDEMYIFKFWRGTDSNGEPIYIRKEVDVLNQVKKI